MTSNTGAAESTREFVDSLPEEVAEAVRAAAVPHWFDAPILAALLGVSDARAQKLMALLPLMPLTQPRGDGRFALHELARQTLLADLWQADQERYRQWSGRAADFFAGQAEADPHLRIESIYHRLLADPKQGDGEVWHWGAEWYNTFQYALVFALLQAVLEHAVAGRLAGRASGWNFFLQALYKATRFPDALDWCLSVLYTRAGVAERPWLHRLIALVTRVQNAFFAHSWAAMCVGSALHLWVGLLLWLSGVRLPTPDGLALLQSMAWLALTPPLLATLSYRYGQLPVPAEFSSAARLALWLRILAAISLNVGLIAIIGIYSSVALFAGLGFWGLLSPLGQWISILPLQLASLLLGLVQADSHRIGFLTSYNVRPIALDGADAIMVIAGYLMLLGPALYFLFFPGLLAPPSLNLFVGGINIVVSLLLYRERKL